MLIARVIGEVVATHKHASHEGRKILLVQPLHLDDSPRGDVVLAMDSVDAGVGDKVLLTQEGFSAMTSVGRPQSPIDMAVIGFIDSVTLDGDSTSVGGLSSGGSTGHGTGPGASADRAPTFLEPLRSDGEKLLLPAVPVNKKSNRKRKSN